MYEPDRLVLRGLLRCLRNLLNPIIDCLATHIQHSRLLNTEFLFVLLSDAPNYFLRRVGLVISELPKACEEHRGVVGVVRSVEVGWLRIRFHSYQTYNTIVWWQIATPL